MKRRVRLVEMLRQCGDPFGGEMSDAGEIAAGVAFAVAVAAVVAVAVAVGW